MGKKKERKEPSLISMSPGEREKVMDEVLVKEEGVITEYDSASGMGKVKSLNDGSVYLIDRRGSLSIGTELRPGEKVLFAPIEDVSGDDYARIIQIAKPRV